MELSNEQFHYWKQNPVTIAFMKKLQWVQDTMRTGMFNEDTIRGDKCQQILSECLGGMNILAQILNFEYLDLSIPVEEEEGEEDVNIV